jgi:glycosyltransferase involved in cell wall biosynthesis
VATRKKVLFIVPYPLREAPSQRFRFEQYFAVLKANSIDFDVQAFLPQTLWRVFYGTGNVPKKSLVILGGFWRRIVCLTGVWRYDFVFIHREAAPIGPPIFEWLIAKVCRRKIIYDYDDAIWLTDVKSETRLNRLIKNRGKVSTICALSYRVSCGNSYLAAYAGSYNTSVVVNPTTIDTDGLHVKNRVPLSGKENQQLTIGWTGSHSTLKYLETIEFVLQRIEQAYPAVNFVVIADKPPKLAIRRMTFVPWKEESEIADLMTIDIGIMPLPDDEWSKGKCGFKILQYMSLNIPSVSSAVGVNQDIVRHNENGFLCTTDEEWFRALATLIESPTLRHQFGVAGRETVVHHYSVNSNTATVLSLFE